MRQSFLRQKLANAIFGMAADKSNIKLRLKHAYKECGSFSEDHFSRDVLRDDWREIKRKLRSYGPVLDSKGKELISSEDNTVDYLSEDECVDIAQKMIRIFSGMLAMDGMESNREMLSRF